MAFANYDFEFMDIARIGLYNNEKKKGREAFGEKKSSSVESSVVTF